MLVVVGQKHIEIFAFLRLCLVQSHQVGDESCRVGSGLAVLSLGKQQYVVGIGLQFFRLFFQLGVVGVEVYVVVSTLLTPLGVLYSRAIVL